MYTVKLHKNGAVRETEFPSLIEAEDFMDVVEKNNSGGRLELFNHKNDCLKSYAI